MLVFSLFFAQFCYERRADPCLPLQGYQCVLCCTVLWTGGGMYCGLWWCWWWCDPPVSLGWTWVCWPGQHRQTVWGTDQHGVVLQHHNRSLHHSSPPQSPPSSHSSPPRSHPSQPRPGWEAACAQCWCCSSAPSLPSLAQTPPGTEVSQGTVCQTVPRRVNSEQELFQSPWAEWSRSWWPATSCPGSWTPSRRRWTGKNYRVLRPVRLTIFNLNG